MATTSEDAKPLYVYPIPKGLDVSCPVCFKALYKDPYISVECGHHFCGPCCERLHECPKCRCRLQTIPDRGLQRALKSLQVYCSERDAGCSWEGELGELQKHQEDDCVYFEVECSFCTTMSGPRHQVLKHEQEECLYRPATCEHCTFQCNWQELNEVHYQECPMYPVDCSICNKTVARRDVEKHKNDLCCKASVACEAHKYGCDWVGLPEEQAKHLKSSLISHFSMCTQHCCSELESVKERIDKSMEEISSKVETAQETIERCQEEIRQLKKENYDKDKEITLLRQKVSQLQDSTMMDNIISRLKSEVKEEIMKEFAGGRGIIKQFPTSDDSVVSSFGSFASSTSDDEEEVFKEKSVMKSEEDKGEDGDKEKDDDFVKQKPTFTYQLKNFSKWKAKEEVCYSKPFYTSDNGYRMRLRVHPNGCGNGRGHHLSAYVCILKGSFDTNLSWPFYGEVTIELCSSKPQVKPHQIVIYYTYKVPEMFSTVVENHNGKWTSKANGSPTFLSHLKLDQYLQFDDSLTFNVFVEVKRYSN